MTAVTASAAMVSAISGDADDNDEDKDKDDEDEDEDEVKDEDDDDEEKDDDDDDSICVSSSSSISMIPASAAAAAAAADSVVSMVDTSDHWGKMTAAQPVSCVSGTCQLTVPPVSFSVLRHQGPATLSY